MFEFYIKYPNDDKPKLLKSFDSTSEVNVIDKEKKSLKLMEDIGKKLKHNIK